MIKNYYNITILVCPDVPQRHPEGAIIWDGGRLEDNVCWDDIHTARAAFTDACKYLRNNNIQGVCKLEGFGIWVGDPNEMPTDYYDRGVQCYARDVIGANPPQRLQKTK